VQAIGFTLSLCVEVGEGVGLGGEEDTATQNMLRDFVLRSLVFLVYGGPWTLPVLLLLICLSRGMVVRMVVNDR
jgi:hypothetical protein